MSKPTFPLDPVTCRHVAESRRMILAAADKVAIDRIAPRRAIALGAGLCDDIPLVELARRFKHVTLTDSDPALLERGLAAAHLDEHARERIAVEVGDLTGTTDALLQEIIAALAASDEPANAIERISLLADCRVPPGMQPTEKCDLVIVSCVLSQLHVQLTHGANELFERRFPGQIKLLQESPRWTSALDRLARRMEARFVDDLLALVSADGVLFLSESVRVCFVELSEDGRWQTEGAWRMLRSNDLADYLDARFTVLTRGAWPYVVWPPQQAGEVGRLFDVQGLLVAARR